MTQIKRRSFARAILASSMMVAMVAVAGCAGSDPEPSARLRVVYPEGDVPSGATITVRADGEKLGVLGPGCALDVRLAPGSHLIAFDWPGGGADRRVELTGAEDVALTLSAAGEIVDAPGALDAGKACREPV